MAMVWTETRIEMARNLAEQGLSGGQIAERWGCGRSAVIAGCKRYGITLRGKGGKRTDARPESGVRLPNRTKQQAATDHGMAMRISQRQALADARSAPPIEERASDPVVPFDQLTLRGCRWPIGKPGDPGFGFCRHTRLGTLSYCAGHAARAYKPKD